MMEMIQKKISFAFIFLKLLQLVLHVGHSSGRRPALREQDFKYI